MANINTSYCATGLCMNWIPSNRYLWLSWELSQRSRAEDAVMCVSQKLYLQPFFLHLFFYLLSHYYSLFLLPLYFFILLPLLFSICSPHPFFPLLLALAAGCHVSCRACVGPESSDCARCAKPEEVLQPQNAHVSHGMCLSSCLSQHYLDSDLICRGKYTRPRP